MKKVVMKGNLFVKEHKKLINLLRVNAKKMINEANDQEKELKRYLKK
jgi:hypothetical protein